MEIVKKEKFSRAFVEVEEILNHMSKEDKEQIPEEFRNMMMKNKASNYNFQLDDEKDLEEQGVMRETKIILAYIFTNYWSTERQKELIKQKFLREFFEMDEEKREKYPIEVFKSEKLKENKEDNNDGTQLVKYEEVNLIRKFLHKIKKSLIHFFKD